MSTILYFSNFFKLNNVFDNYNSYIEQVIWNYILLIKHKVPTYCNRYPRHVYIMLDFILKEIH